MVNWKLDADIISPPCRQLQLWREASVEDYQAAVKWPRSNSTIARTMLHLQAWKIRQVQYLSSFKVRVGIINLLFHFQCGSIIKSSCNGAATTLQICNLSKEDLAPSRDAKFSSGIHVSCPHLGCSMKNSQFQQTGRFPAGSIMSHVVRLHVMKISQYV